MFKLGTWVLAGYGGYMLYRQYIAKDITITPNTGM